MDKYIILSTKQVARDKIIALVAWINLHKDLTYVIDSGTSKELSDLNPWQYSTHCIYPEGCEGLHHGNYYENIEDAVENFKERR